MDEKPLVSCELRSESGNNDRIRETGEQVVAEILAKGNSGLD